MSDQRKTIRPDQLPFTTNIAEDDILILFQNGEYKALKYKTLKFLVGEGGSGNGLVQVDTITFSTNGTYTIPDFNLLEKIIVISTTNINLRIGSTNGQDDILPEFPISSNTPASFDLNIYTESSKQLYISGITSTTKIKFKRVITE